MCLCRVVNPPALHTPFLGIGSAPAVILRRRRFLLWRLSPLFLDLLRTENAERVDNKNNVLNHLGLLDFCREADIISIGLRRLRWLLGCISFLLWRAVGYVAFYYALMGCV